MKLRAAVVLSALSLVMMSFGDSNPYTFTMVKNLDHTNTKDQCNTGTCWSFATTSFLESELMRIGKGQHDLSEMFNVRHTYPRKAEAFVRLQGKHQFGPGALSHDVINTVATAGMVPEEAYSGNPLKKDYDHGELDAILDATVKAVVKGGKPSSQYDEAIEGVLNAYLGDAPEKFTYQGKEYTPESFRDAMGVNADNYVSITSFTHHPFYSDFVLEVPDNFSMERFYNLPLNELMASLDHALENGYTVAWDADVSSRGFSFKNGLAIVPELPYDKEKYFKEKLREKNVTQEMRQELFDNQTTTDDHLMHLTGWANDQDGDKYYVMKNSWGSENPYGGEQYVSVPFMKLNTVAFLLHKDALPKELRKKLGL